MYKYIFEQIQYVKRKVSFPQPIWSIFKQNYKSTFIFLSYIMKISIMSYVMLAMKNSTL